jgi:BlaR1 peptidase M56
VEQITHILADFSAAAAGSLVGAIWEGAVLAASVALCLHFVRVISAGVRSVLWTAVFLLVMLLHFVPLLGGNQSAAAVASGRILHLGLGWSVALVCVWSVLSLARGIQLMRSAFGLRRIARRATPVAASPECAALLRTSYRSAELCASADVDRPSVIGFFKPRVLIPLDLLEKISASELEQIVMHEMEHLRRADDWTNLIQKISLVLFPLNPVLLWVERRLCMERELACDDRVLHCTKARKAYATCLVNLAEHSVLRRGASLVLGAWERQSEVGRRVRRILRQPEGVMGRRQMKIVTSVLVLGMVGGALTLAREPQLVSFAPAPETHAETNLLPASGYEPASFRSTREAPRMINTVFHEPVQESKAATATAVKKLHHRKAPRPEPAAGPTALKAAMNSRVRRAPQTTSFVVLTDWVDSPLPPRLRLVVSDDAHSYAAVQTMNGWLIVQL